MNRLKEKFNTKIVPEMKKEFKYSNIFEIPRIKKVMVNAGIGSFRESREAVESFVSDLSALTGQKPSPRSAKTSIAGFKVRENDVVGYTVTLRGERMWAFLDKFISLALPRVRDFRGLNPDAFDKNGNFSVGIREHVIFPEVNANNTKAIRSLQMTVVMTSSDKVANTFLLKSMGIPFKEKEAPVRATKAR